MSFYQPEPPYQHSQIARTGILLINLGTPEAPTAKALRPYLKEFLSDRRVVEIPRPIWWLILNGIILNTRPKKSAEKYASIWRPEGSPLKHFTARQAEMLRAELARRSSQPIIVEYAMRYGQPSVDAKIRAMKAQGVDRILLLPLYPQYAASSTGSALDAAWHSLLRQRNPPEVRALKHFHADAGYIDALRRNVQAYWAEHGRPDVLVMSFHGIPRRSLDLGDPYHCECHRTGRLLAEALELAPAQYRISFQSRFGRAEWLKPYTVATLEELGETKTGRVDVICPGFIADCLETLEGNRHGRKRNISGSRRQGLSLYPGAERPPVWIDALTNLALSQMGGWLDPANTESNLSQAANIRQQRASAMGANN